IFSKVDVVASSELPILKIFEEISPILSIAMSFVLFGMIFNTGLSMFYGFIARFVDVEDKQKNYRFIVMTCVVGFVFSFIVSILFYNICRTFVYFIINYLTY